MSVPGYIRLLVCLSALGLNTVLTRALAQSPFNCNPALGEAYLEANNVKARVLNNGELFFRGEPHVYEVPAGNGVQALYAASLWLGGYIDNDLRIAATRYGPFEFWAGPVESTVSPSMNCSDFDRVFNVRRDDVVAFERTGVASRDLEDWPTGLGAPTRDRFGNRINLMDLALAARRDRIIDLEAGERPIIRGDQMIWWVMNDAGNYHSASDSDGPIRVEVHGSAFAMNSGITAVRHSTVYSYRIINRNPSSFEDAYVGVFVDPDLGHAGDDYVGVDTTLGLAFAYNADNFDEGEYGYGEAPPAIGFLLLEGPEVGNGSASSGPAEDAGLIEPSPPMSRFGKYIHLCASPGCDGPYEGEFYDYLRFLRRGGLPYTRSWLYPGDPDTTAIYFMYPGDPVPSEYWSEMNIDGTGTMSKPGDRRFHFSSGPFSLEPGEESEFTFAVVWSRGTDHLDSVRKLKEDAAAIKHGFDIYDAPFVNEPIAPAEFPLQVLAAYPNPFAEKTQFSYSLPHPAFVRVALYDVWGREIRILEAGVQGAGPRQVRLNAASLASGTYFIRTEIEHAASTQAVVVVK